MVSVTSPLLPYRLSICGLDEIAGFSRQGVTHAVSLLDPDWPDPESFSSFSGCRRMVFRFHDVIDEDEGTVAPATDILRAILEHGRELRGARVGHLLVHCHAGVSRSTATAAILLTQFNPGRERDAFAEIARLRPWSWPNSRMVALADELLGRGGRLVDAMRSHHARMIEDWPDLAAPLREGKRAREFLSAAR